MNKIYIKIFLFFNIDIQRFNKNITAFIFLRRIHFQHFHFHAQRYGMIKKLGTFTVKNAIYDKVNGKINN